MPRFRKALLIMTLCLFLTVGSPESGAGAELGAGAEPGPTGFQWPIQPPNIVTAFDPPAHPYGPGHRGVDLAAAVGAEIRAAGTGRVIYAGTLAGRGVISIEHQSGLRTTYEPIKPMVTAGNHVLNGQVIGTVMAGHPRCTGQVCLHWGAKIGDYYLDPARLISGWQVRLLPWDR